MVPGERWNTYQRLCPFVHLDLGDGEMVAVSSLPRA